MPAKGRIFCRNGLVAVPADSSSNVVLGAQYVPDPGDGAGESFYIRDDLCQPRWDRFKPAAIAARRSRSGSQSKLRAASFELAELKGQRQAPDSQNEIALDSGRDKVASVAEPLGLRKRLFDRRKLLFTVVTSQCT